MLQKVSLFGTAARALCEKPWEYWCAIVWHDACGGAARCRIRYGLCKAFHQGQK